MLDDQQHPDQPSSGEPLSSVGYGNNGDGRGPNGRFQPGNKLATGNPNNKKAQQLRNALLAAVSEEDIREALTVIRQIMRDETAKPGERLQAIGELFDRTLGKPIPADLQAEIDELRHEIETLAGGSK